MPRWGQLGCQGFIILDSSGKVACETTPPFMEFENLAFQYVEMALSSLLASKPVPSVGPGVIVRISKMQFGSPQKQQIASAMGLRDGQPALCLTAENADGECQVNFGRGKKLWIKRTSLIANDQKDDASDCGGGDCGGGG